jgi:hypothetical protein
LTNNDNKDQIFNFRGGRKSIKSLNFDFCFAVHELSGGPPPKLTKMANEAKAAFCKVHQRVYNDL